MSAAEGAGAAPETEKGNPELLAKYGFDDFELVRTYRDKALFVMACYKFVKNFKPDQQLKVLPSGAVRLENVELEPSFLWTGVLPGSLKFARVGALQFDASLFQDPSKEATRVAIRDAYFLVIAGDKTTASASAAASDAPMDAASSVKSAILGLLRRFSVAFAPSTPENVRVFELTVLKHMVIDVENVHVRFEDAVTGLTGRHGPPFQYALGFVAETLRLTDLSTEAAAPVVTMAKSMAWTGLAVYLCEDVMYQDAATFDTPEAMLDAFLEGVFSPPDAFPPLVGKCDGRCDVSVGPDASSPAGTLDVKGDLSSLNVTVANQHFRCLAALQEAFSFDVQACLSALLQMGSPEKFGAIATADAEPAALQASTPPEDKDAEAPLLDTHALLCVTVCEAANLPPSFSTMVTDYSDAFVKLKLRRGQGSDATETLLQTTKVSPKSKYPLWLEAFPFEVEADLYRTEMPSADDEEDQAGDEEEKALSEEQPDGESEAAGGESEAVDDAETKGEAGPDGSKADAGTNDSDKTEGAPSESTPGRECALVVELYDHNMFADALIGSASVSLTKVFAAKEAMRGDERILELELSPAYAKDSSGSVATTVTVLISYEPNKKEEATRKHRPEETFSDPDKSVFEIPALRTYPSAPPPAPPRPIFEVEPAVDKPKPSMPLVVHKRANLALGAVLGTIDPTSLLSWTGVYSSSTIELSLGSIVVTFVKVPDGAAVDELAEDLSDTIVYRIASPPDCAKTTLKFTKLGSEESVDATLSPLEGSTASSDQATSNLSIPATALTLARKAGEMVTVSIGNGAERWEVKATDTAATMAALAGIVPPEPSLAVPSGMLTPLFQATLQAGLDALGCKSLLRFGEGTATAASPAAPVTAPAESSDDPGDDTAAKLEAKERELKLLRRELTQAKKLKRERLAKQAEFSEGRTEEMMIEENERLRVELEDVTEKAKELQKIKGELMTQAAEDKKTIRTLQGSAEDTKKKLQFQKKWVKNHADILKTMDSFAKMQGGNTFALADTPEINDKATKLYEARNKLLRARNAQLEVVLRERMTYVCCLGIPLRITTAPPLPLPFSFVLGVRFPFVY